MLGLGALGNAGWRDARRGRNNVTLLLARQQQSRSSIRHQQIAIQKIAILLDQIRASYTLGYVTNSTKANQSFHVIRIALAPSLPQKHPELHGKTMVLRTKQGYYR
jgi:hypothetical protein